MKLEYILRQKGGMVATIPPDATVNDLLARLAEHNIGALVVSTDGARVEGIVSERDVVRHITKQGPQVLDQPVSTIMTTTVMCAPPQATTSDLMAVMTDSRIRHIPVLDDGERMIGIVSIGDVVKSRVSELEDENTALVDYIYIGR